MIKSIRQVKNLKGKRVLVRADFNVPLASGKVGRSEDFRIVRSAPTIEYLIKSGAKVILMAHLGRPEGKFDPKFSLKPVAKRLSQVIGRPVQLSPEVIGEKTDKLASQMKNGEILLLENMRFDAREEIADKKFAAGLAKLGDIFVKQEEAKKLDAALDEKVARLKEIAPNSGTAMILLTNAGKVGVYGPGSRTGWLENTRITPLPPLRTGAKRRSLRKAKRSTPARW